MKNLASLRLNHPWIKASNILFIINWLFINIALANNLTSNNLFTWTTTIPDIALQQLSLPQQEIKRSHFGHLHLDQIVSISSPDGAEQITLNLFSDVLLTAVKDRLERRSLTSYSWFGHIANALQSQVILTIEQGGIAGNITVQNEPYGAVEIYQIRPIPGGLHEIRQIDQSIFQEKDNIEGKPDYIPVITHDVDLPPNNQADDGSTIDVMVIYTDAAAVASTNIAAEIQLGVDETNQSYINSGINQRIRLVQKAQVSYTETGTLCNGNPSDLERLADKNDGYLDNIHNWRDTYAADIVSLWVENGGGLCGCGYFMENVSSAFSESAFNVVARNCATGYYSFGHEMGHNMGAMHDWYVDNGTNPYLYAHGYVNTTNRWRTIMAYNNVCSDLGLYCTRIQYWSNPSVSYQGNPTGIAEGQSNPADNHKTLNNTAYTVANFRASSVTRYLAGVTSAGKIYYTTNLTTWKNIPGGLNQLVMGNLDGNGAADLAGLTSSGQIYYTTNLTTWNNIPGVLNQLVAGDLDGNGKADLAGITSAGKIYYTTNLTTWKNIPGGLNQLVTSDLDDNGKADLAGLTSAGKIYYTTNLTTWKNIPGVLDQLAGD